MCTGWPTTAMPKPSFLSERVFSHSMVVMWWSVLMWLVAGWDPNFCGWLWDDARWGNVASCEMSCHVMSCDVIWCVFILCDAISCFVWCHVMHCDVMWCPPMWWSVICYEVMRRNGMRSYEFVMRCGWLRWHVVWFEWLFLSMKWKMSCWSVLQSAASTTQYYKVLQSTTPYSKILQSGQYYSVPQSTTLYYKLLPRTPRHSDTENFNVQPSAENMTRSHET